MERPLQKYTWASLDLSAGRILGERPAAEDSPARNTELARILIADHHPIFRDGLCMLLEAQGEFRVVGVAADGEETIRLVRELQPDVLLLDLAIKRCRGSRPSGRWGGSRPLSG